MIFFVLKKLYTYSLKLLTKFWTVLEFMSMKSELVELNFIINETLQSFILLHVLNLEVIVVPDVAIIVVDPFNVEFDALF
jgi:hypothetical protein